jgi:DNA (cytosine-5)-methyltransferase 1
MKATARSGRGLTRHTQAGRIAWPPEARERGDFCHPPRSFPDDIRAWRETFTRWALEHRRELRGVRSGAAIEEVRSLVDLGIAELREVSRILELLHKTPTLGNKRDPVDELVYIILARKTREAAYSATFDDLKRHYPRWEELLRDPPGKVTRIIRRGGLGDKKTRSIRGALRTLLERFGSCTLAPARRWSDRELEAFLCSLPEISRKSAYCIMMYSLGRRVFPVDAHVGRVLQRLGIYKELQVSLAGKDHKQLQAALADAVPPNLRHSLHVNLLVHGREVCHARSPECGRCEIRRFCATFRERQRVQAVASGAPTVVDLFSGAGGLSEGFARAGFRIVAAVDSDPVALQTLWLNHEALGLDDVIARSVEHLRASELKRKLGRQRLDVLVGAPPCQGFSTVGFRSKVARTGYRVLQDERNFLFEYLVHVALALTPRLFLMENVPGMRTARRDDLSFLDAAARMLERGGGYRTGIWKLNATGFGVPQDRTRCFLVASREDRLPIAPAEEYQDVRRPNFDVDALPPVTLDEALLGIPPLDAGTGTAVEVWDPRARVMDERKQRRYLGKFRLLTSSPLIYNHFARYNNERDLELYSLLRPGEDSVHALERHKRSDLMKYRRDVFDDKYARLRGDRPCKTIVSHLAKDGNGYIHPREVRNITVREAARVQSFRDDYVFCGSPTDQWTQVGNAVPPLMSEAIARTFLRVLKGRQP